MKHQLYYYPGNANLAPHILLEEAGCEVELVLVDRAAGAQKSPEYLRLNPGRIPTLVCGDHPGDLRIGTLHKIEKDMAPCLGNNWLAR